MVSLLAGYARARMAAIVSGSGSAMPTPATRSRGPGGLGCRDATRSDGSACGRWTPEHQPPPTIRKPAPSRRRACHDDEHTHARRAKGPARCRPSGWATRAWRGLRDGGHLPGVLLRFARSALTRLVGGALVGVERACRGCGRRRGAACRGVAVPVLALALGVVAEVAAWVTMKPPAKAPPISPAAVAARAVRRRMPPNRRRCAGGGGGGPAGSMLSVSMVVSFVVVWWVGGIARFAGVVNVD